MVNEAVTHPLVAVACAEVPFSDVQSFSKRIFAVIGAFDVARLREELVINVP